MAIEKDVLDQLLAGRDPDEVFARGGLLDDLKKALSERILNAELDAHLEGEPAEARRARLPVPDYSTLCRRQRTLAVQLPYRGARGPLHLLIDSTGIKVRGEGEWHARKHGGARRRVWRKVHLAVDEATLEVRAVEITGSQVGDAPVLPDLLGQIPADEAVASVTADGAYDTRKCHDAITGRGADAVIPPHRNARPWKKDSPGAGARNEALRAVKRLGRTIWRRWSDYHRRSRVEAKMNCVKLLGQKLMARDFDRQTAELQVHVAILNRYTALGIPVTKPVV